MATVSANLIREKCASPNCGNPVEHKLACPKCMQLGLPATYFCSQTCFKENYEDHKKVHAIAKQLHLAQQQQQQQKQVPTRYVRARLSVCLPSCLSKQ